MSTPEIRFRQGTEEDGPGIVRLFNTVFKKSRTVEEWRWRYMEGPCRKLLTILAVDHSERIVAHYALHPLWLTYRGKRVLGAQSLDTMVDPEFQGRGLFVETARRCYQLAKENGVKLLYGFPNENSHHGLEKSLTWLEARDLRFLYFFLDARRYLREAGDRSGWAGHMGAVPLALWSKYSIWTNARGSGRGKTVLHLGAFEASFDRLWDACRCQFSVGVWKDSEYLNWRYRRLRGGENTVWTLGEGDQIDGFILLSRTREKGAWIGSILEILAREPVTANLQALIRAALSHLRLQGLPIAKVVLSPDSAYWRGFQAAGFFHFFRPGGNANVLCLGDPAEFDASLLRLQWHMIGGDTDYIEGLQ
jgi:predicted N-acetyltransferase YhbS